MPIRKRRRIVTELPSGADRGGSQLDWFTNKPEGDNTIAVDVVAKSGLWSPSDNVSEQLAEKVIDANAVSRGDIITIRSMTTTHTFAYKQEVLGISTRAITASYPGSASQICIGYEHKLLLRAVHDSTEWIDIEPGMQITRYVAQPSDPYNGLGSVVRMRHVKVDDIVCDGDDWDHPVQVYAILPRDSGDIHLVCRPLKPTGHPHHITLGPDNYIRKRKV